MFKLIIREAEKDAGEVSLEERNYTLGRDQKSDIILSGEAVSRKHACITFDKGVYVLEDLQSTAGIYVNKEKIQGQCILKGGDRILIGSNTLLFEEEAPATEPETDEDTTKVLSPEILKKYLEDEKVDGEDDTAVFEVPEEVAQTFAEGDKTRVLAVDDRGIAGQSEPIDDGDKTMIVTPEATSTPLDDDRTVIVPTRETPSVHPDHHRLLVISNTPAGEYFLDQADITLGRSEECSITLEDSTISSFHARFRVEGDRCFITDMASSNGTTVNGVRVGEGHQLCDGDEIKVGAIKLRFVHRNTTASREEIIAEIKRQGTRKLLKMAGVGGGALLCIVVFLVLLSPQLEQPDKQAAIPAGKLGQDMLEPLAAPPSTPAIQDTPIEADKLATTSADLFYDTAQELMSYRLWDEAIEKLMEIEKIEENYSDLDSALLLARTEAFNRDLFEKGLRLISEGDPNAGILSLEGVPENSVYHAEALLEIQFTREQLPPMEGEASLSAGVIGDGTGGFTAAKEQEFINQVLKYYAQGDLKIALTKLDTALAAQEVDSDDGFKEKLAALKQDMVRVKELYAQGQSEYDKKNLKKAFQTWSEVVSLDQKLVGDTKSHFSSSIAVYMADEFYRQAREDYEKGNYAAARNTCMKALTASPEHEGCTEITQYLGQIAKKLYEEGYILEDLNPSLAIKKWRQVLEVCPPDNPYYQKTKSKIARYETP